MTVKDNKLIVKNTAMLYIRMLLTMAVTLYTSRIVLNTLGIEDFGIYNVVGGFVTMFSFLNSAMASATQRFLSFEIGKKDLKQLKNVFSMSVNIHFIIAFVIFIFAETVGLWFVNTKLTIPAERMIAVGWVYQFSILALLVNMVSVPYDAIIIAHERMNVFAWIGIIEVSLKLFIVFMLVWFGFDKLKLYAVLMFGVALTIRLIYGYYCSRNFSETKFRWFWDKTLYRILMSFAGWNLFGTAAVVFYGQGLNILLNIFFGPVVNAAYGIAYRLQSALNSFVVNFQMAINPQIVKSYAGDDLIYMRQLIYKGAKYSFFLLFTLSLPILLETEIILKIWLKIVPEYTVTFTQLILVNILISNLSGVLGVASQATGKIKLYQGLVGGLLLLIIPISYIYLKIGASPQVVFYISIAISVISLFVRIIILKRLVKIEMRVYFTEVVFNAMIVGFIAIILPYIIHLIFKENLFRLFMVGTVSIISAVSTIYLIGLDKVEKSYFKDIALNIVDKYFLRK